MGQPPCSLFLSYLSWYCQQLEEQSYVENRITTGSHKADKVNRLERAYMSDISFFPVGNADTCLLTTDNGQQLLFDFAAPKNQGGEDRRIELDKELKDRLARSGRDYYDVVSFSHLDKDHFAGSSEFFYFEHAKKYQGEGRIYINEMWVPAAAILESQWEQSTEGRIIQAEARHRLKEGKGIRVISEPKALDKWLSDNGIDAEERRDLIVSAGNLMPGFDLEKVGAEIFVHAPFSYQREDGTEVDRNAESSVFHLTLQDGASSVKVFLTADAPHEVLEDIVKATEKHGNIDRLEWDLMKVPHHCSYLSLGPEKGTDETEPTEEVARLYGQYGRESGIIVSPSNAISESDETQPPHKQAAKYYSKIADEKDGEFRVTMEYPSKDTPKPLKVDVKGHGKGASIATPNSGNGSDSQNSDSEGGTPRKPTPKPTSPSSGGARHLEHATPLFPASRTFRPDSPYATPTRADTRARHDLTPLSAPSKEWLATNQPLLHYNEAEGTVRGTVKFRALWDEESQDLTVNPRFPKSLRTTLITDEYQVVVKLRYKARWIGPNNEVPNRYPPVFEEGTRTSYLAMKLGVSLADLHLYPDGEFCIGFRPVPPDRQTFDLPTFIEESLIAWLYRLSYVEQFGLDQAKQRLWPAYDHRYGPQQYLRLIEGIAKSDPQDSDLCPCDSQEPYGQCHQAEVAQLARDGLIQAPAATRASG